MTQPVSIQVRKEDNSMENINAYLGIHEHLELFSKEEAAQVFEKTLSTRLPSLYRNALRLLVIQPMRRMRFRMLCSLPIPTWTSSRGRHRCRVG